MIRIDAIMGKPMGEAESIYDKRTDQADALDPSFY